MRSEISANQYAYEFSMLFRFRLYSYYKLFTVYTPDTHNVSAAGYDDLETLRTKILGFVKYDNMVPEEDFVINYTPPTKQLHTIKEFKDFMIDLNKKMSSYEIKRVMHGDDLSETLRKFEMKIVDALSEHGMMQFTDGVLGIISDLVETLQLSGKEKEGFYRDLVNSSAAQAGFLTILSQTIKEFLQHTNPSREKEVLDAADHCGCHAFSISGKQNGFSEPRGTLFFDIMRIAEYHRPKILELYQIMLFGQSVKFDMLPFHEEGDYGAATKIIAEKPL